MRRALLAAALALSLVAASGARADLVFADPGFDSETLPIVLQGLFPVGLTWAPDGAMFVWTQRGQVRIVRDGVLLPTPFVDLAPRVNYAQDRGLLGFALAPDFAVSRLAYLLYTYESAEPPDPASHAPRTARLTRVTADPANPDVALPGSEVVLLGTWSTPPCNAVPLADCMPADSDSHTIGTVRFAPDGSLFVGNGDGAWYTHVDGDALRAQDLDRLAGKILRILPGGAGHPGNPFYQPATPNSIQSKVWAYGLRNPFRFALDPELGEPWIGDVGWNEWEELDRGRGANFGWPCFEGLERQKGYNETFVFCQNLPGTSVTAPSYAYPHGDGFAVVAGAFYTANQFPPAYRGSLFLADFASSWIRRARFSNGTLVDVVDFAENAEGPVAIEQGPDGCLYVVSVFAGTIQRACALPLFADDFESGNTTAWSIVVP